MLEIRQTATYAQWFKGLRDRQTRVRIQSRIDRLSLGNLGDVKPVGEGVSELRIDYGPGYRVYFVQRGKTLVVLLAGETNAHKIEISKPRWTRRATCRSALWARLKPIPMIQLSI